MKPEPPYLRLTLESQATAAFERESRRQFIAQASRTLQAVGGAAARPRPAARVLPAPAPSARRGPAPMPG